MQKARHTRALKELEYCASTGAISCGGAVLGTVNALGYVVLRVDGKVQAAHRIAWLLYYGTPPKENIDHINGVRADNRIANLRDVSHALNAQNTAHGRGAHFHKPTGGWKSAIRIGGRNIHLGYFSSAEEAEEVFSFAKSFFHEPKRSTTYA